MRSRWTDHDGVTAVGHTLAAILTGVSGCSRQCSDIEEFDDRRGLQYVGCDFVVRRSRGGGRKQTGKFHWYVTR